MSQSLTFYYRNFIAYLHFKQTTYMKRIYYVIALTFIGILSFTSCSDKTTYADELKAEKNLIKDYIKRNNIKVLSSFPKDDVWGPNDYVLTSTGLYYHLESKGDTVTLQTGNLVIPRYIQHTLGIPADTIKNWSTIDSADPDRNFIYGDASQSCPAFQETVGYMKNNESVAKIIVHSKIGFEENWTPATPIAYLIKIKIKR